MERKLGVSVFSYLFMWGGILPVENDFEWQSGLKNFCPLSFINREFILFPFHFLSILDREPFFPFFCSFLYFYFFSFFFPSISSFTFPSPSLSLGNRVLAFYSLSLEEISLSFASGERRRILLIGQGSKKSKVDRPRFICNNIHVAPEKGVGGTERSTGFFPPNRITCFLQRKINHSREHHILEKQYTCAKGNLPCNRE